MVVEDEHTEASGPTKTPNSIATRGSATGRCRICRLTSASSKLATPTAAYVTYSSPTAYPIRQPRSTRWFIMSFTYA